jgi:hypothetical protein
VRSYWDEANTYNGMLQGVVIPGNMTRVSAPGSQPNLADARSASAATELLKRLSVDELLELMASDA